MRLITLTEKKIEQDVSRRDSPRSNTYTHYRVYVLNYF